MITLEQKMEEFVETAQALENVVLAYNRGLYAYLGQLWQTVFAMHELLHEYCNQIESGSFDEREFYSTICDALGRPKEM